LTDFEVIAPPRVEGQEHTSSVPSSEIVTVFKQWHRKGFISFGLWHAAKKVMVEIGSISGSNELTGATKCYVPLPGFMAYLHADIYGLTDRLFPQFADKGMGWYGGGNNPTGPGVISRIVKIEPWWKDFNNNLDPTSRTIKCGHYEGIRGSQGAIQPNRDKPQLSANQTKMTMAQMAELYYNLNRAITVADLDSLLED
jgi:hypothetical protein